ncbi:hypothetical protein [Celeribacter sp.]
MSNIGQVSETLMIDLEVSQTVYCLALPKNSRTLFMSNLFLGEKRSPNAL